MNTKTVICEIGQYQYNGALYDIDFAIPDDLMKLNTHPVSRNMRAALGLEHIININKTKEYFALMNKSKFELPPSVFTYLIKTYYLNIMYQSVREYGLGFILDTEK